MPNKIIKESINTSESIDRLSAEEERFFYRLLLTSDDHGRFEADSRVLIARCFPLKIGDVSRAQMDAWLYGLEAAGIVKVYEVDGKRYGLFKTWDKHNTLRNQKSKYPGPESATASTVTQPPAVASDCEQLKTVESSCEQLKPSRARHDSDSEYEVEGERKGKGSVEGKGKQKGKPKPNGKETAPPATVSPSGGEGKPGKNADDVLTNLAKAKGLHERLGIPEPTEAEIAETEARRQALKAQYESLKGGAP